MKIAVAADGGGVLAVDGDLAVDLTDRFSDLGSFLAAFGENLELAGELVDDRSAFQLPVSEIGLAAPYVPGAKIACHVVNYRAHGKEVGPPSRPFFFWKPGSAIVAPGGEIEPHRDTQQLDFEVELAVVIGTTARDVAAGDALDHVAGYTILNDVSHRELQFNTAAPDLRERYGMNWVQGKGRDGSCPLGPWIALRDELPDPSALAIRCHVNGVLRQDASTADMLFDVPALLAEATRGVTLYPGDIVATGSPPGTALDDGGPYLEPGDVVTCEIEGIGRLENTVGSFRDAA